MFKHALIALGIVFLSAAPAEAIQRKLALNNDITISYVEQGPKDAPPLILLHGLGDTSRSWSLMLPELAKTHRVYALDQRGHGATTAPRCCYALADMSYDVVAFMEAKKIERAAVVGHSMGSFVAQYLAAHHPERVSQLVLIGSADTTVGTEIVEWLWSQLGTFEGGLTAEFVDQWQSNPLPVDEAFLRAVKKETSDVPMHVWKSVATTLLTDDQRRFLPAIQVPVLILWGEKDPGFLRPNQERLQSALSRATLKAFPEAGHNPHWEIPSQVAREIGTFLAPQPPSTMSANRRSLDF
jgi:non-heme chloroperoxidase